MYSKNIPSIFGINNHLGSTLTGSLMIKRSSKAELAEDHYNELSDIIGKMTNLCSGDK